jgi:hypothetical protein
MDELATDRGALCAATAFLSGCNDWPDPRQAVKVVYPRDEVLLLAVLAGLAGGSNLYRPRSLRCHEAGSAPALSALPR